MKINLPDLVAYRSAFKLKGINYPLPVVNVNASGLLRDIPTAENDKTGWPWTEEVDSQIYDKNIEWPKLTIVTPSYNQGKFIEETIRSVLLQNYPNLEYIIIDGGSTDETVELIKKYSPWLSYWQTGKDRGQGHAINLGFSLASGAYYAWINSDDHYLKGTFLKVVNRFNKNHASFIYGYVLNFATDTQQLSEPQKILPFLDYFIRLPSLAQPSCFWSSSIHQPIWEDLHCALDYELWLRIVKNNKRSLIKEPLSVANIHADAKTSDVKMKEKWHADHVLICSDGAHGPVPDWDRIVFINRMRIKLYKWLRLN